MVILGRDRRRRSLPAWVLDCFGPENPMIDSRPLMKRRGAAMLDKQPAREMPRWDDDRAVAAHREAAEAKRLEARRRFVVLGSGAALSALVTMSPGRAGAVAHSECAAGMDWM